MDSRGNPNGAGNSFANGAGGVSWGRGCQWPAQASPPNQWEYAQRDRYE